MKATNKERAEDAEAKLSKARTALRAMTNAICGETGFANAALAAEVFMDETDEKYR